MTRIGPTDRLSRLMDIVGTRRAKAEPGSGKSSTSAPSPAAEQDMDVLRRRLSSELATIQLDSDGGRHQAQRLVIHGIMVARFDHLNLNAAQLSYLTREVAQKAAQRPEIQALLDEVLDELVAHAD